TGDVIKTNAPIVGSMAGGTPGMLAGLGMTALQSKTADRLGAGVLGRVANVLQNPTMQKAVNEAAKGGAQLVAHAPNYVPGSAQQPIGTMTGAPGMTPPQGGANPYATNALPVGANTPLAQTLAGARQSLQMGLAGMLDPYLAGNYTPAISSGLGVLSSLTPELQKMSGANAALQSAEQAYQQAGGGQ